MFAFLEVAIGLALLYLLVAVFSSYIVEVVASYTNLRATGLERFIAQTLGEAAAPASTQWTKAFYEHPLVKALNTPAASLDSKATPPSYIPPATFSAVLIDLLRQDSRQPPGSPLQIADLRNLLQRGQLPEGLSAILSTTLSREYGSIDRLRANLESWFDANMERASGWYKRHAQLRLFFCALVVSVAFNLDSFYVADSLFKNPQLAAKVADLGQGAAGDGSPEAYRKLNANLLAFAKFSRPNNALDALLALDDQKPDGLRPAALNLVAENYVSPLEGKDAKHWIDLLLPKEGKTLAEHFKSLPTQETPNAPAGPCPPSESAPDARIAGLQACVKAGQIDDKKLGEFLAELIGSLSAPPQKMIDPAIGQALKAYFLAAPKTTAETQALADLRKILAPIRQDAEKLRAQIDDIVTQLPEIGWLCDIARDWTTERWLRAIAGWLITALLASLGSPFWFELLGRLVNLRSVGQKPAATTVKGG